MRLFERRSKYVFSIYGAPISQIPCSKYKNENKTHGLKKLTVSCVYVIALGAEVAHGRKQYNTWKRHWS